MKLFRQVTEQGSSANTLKVAATEKQKALTYKQFIAFQRYTMGVSEEGC